MQITVGVDAEARTADRPQSPIINEARSTTLKSADEAGRIGKIAPVQSIGAVTTLTQGSAPGSILNPRRALSLRSTPRVRLGFSRAVRGSASRSASILLSDAWSSLKTCSTSWESIGRVARPRRMK